MEPKRRKPKPAASDNGDHLSPLTPYGQTELANALRLKRMHGDDLRYCIAKRKWYGWDGTRWCEDQNGTADRCAKHVADSVWQAALAFDDQDAKRYAVKISSARGIEATLRLAQSELPVLPGELDRDPWALNCANGTIDLRTGTLRPHRREDNITMLCPTLFDPDAPSYVWDRTLEAVLVRQDLIDFFQRVIGYTLTGLVTEQLLMIFWGIGSNGKSTLLNAIQQTLGNDYVMKAAQDFLMHKRFSGHSTERMDLFAKRLVICSETADGGRLNEAFVKDLTGSEAIRGRRMREDNWEFEPTHKIILSTNHRPRITGTDHGIWRRLAMLPFVVKFWNQEKGETGPDELRQDKQLPDKLKAEAPGILAWAVRGCLDWQRSGLQMPPDVQAATEEYRQSQDVVAQFIAECCIELPGVASKASELYGAYEEWAKANGETPISGRRFGEGLVERGYVRKVSNGVRYQGVTLRG